MRVGSILSPCGTWRPSSGPRPRQCVPSSAERPPHVPPFVSVDDSVLVNLTNTVSLYGSNLSFSDS